MNTKILFAEGTLDCHAVRSGEHYHSIDFGNGPLRVSFLLLAALLISSVFSESSFAAEDNQAGKSGTALPVRGLHLGLPSKKELAAAVEFIREALTKEGVNTLILEFDYDYNFQSRPE